MVDFWKVKNLDMKKLGEFIIFQVVGGENDQNYFYVRLTGSKNFEDYANFDVRNKVIASSELYNSIEFDINAGNIKMYPSKVHCIYAMLSTLYDEVKDDSDILSYYFVNVSKLIASGIQ